VTWSWSPVKLWKAGELCAHGLSRVSQLNFNFKISGQSASKTAVLRVYQIFFLILAQHLCYILDALHEAFFNLTCEVLLYLQLRNADSLSSALGRKLMRTINFIAPRRLTVPFSRRIRAR